MQFFTRFKHSFARIIATFNPHDEKTFPPSTKVLDALAQLGGNIRLARVRRRVTSALLAERIGVSHTTMTAIERGAPGVAVGHYASALFSLGLLADLGKVATADELGRRMQDLGLPSRVHLPKLRKDKA